MIWRVGNSFSKSPSLLLGDKVSMPFLVCDVKKFIVLDVAHQCTNWAWFLRCIHKARISLPINIVLESVCWIRIGNLSVPILGLVYFFPLCYTVSLSALTRIMGQFWSVLIWRFWYWYLYYWLYILTLCYWLSSVSVPEPIRTVYRYQDQYRFSNSFNIVIQLLP